MDLSVIIVNFNGGPLLTECVRAAWASCEGLEAEILVVDNGSTDGSAAALHAADARAQIIANPSNDGYARANNLAIRRARGRYLLLLNPDVIVEQSAVQIIVEFMERHADVGICGPKVLLPNGRLDAPCRRSFKTAGTYFYKMLGLSRCFPKHPHFGHYYLSYLDEDQQAEVDAVIGAFLVIRRETAEEIGPLDERFFMYCEDEDWCYRAKRAGWRVVYHPRAKVVHYKSTAARKVPFRTAYAWHRSLFLFHQKHLAGRYPFIVNYIVYAGIVSGLFLALGKSGAVALLTGSRDLAKSR